MLYIFPLFTAVIFPEKKTRTSGIHFICTGVDTSLSLSPCFPLSLCFAGHTCGNPDPGEPHWATHQAMPAPGEGLHCVSRLAGQQVSFCSVYSDSSNTN